MQGVKGVEELFLGLGFAGDELNIIDQQHIHLAVFFAQSCLGFRADGRYQVVGEFLAGNIEYTLALAGDRVADGMQNVSFAQAHAAVKKERVVGFGRVFGHSHASGMRQAVAWANHKTFKVVAADQASAFQIRG